MYCSRIHRAIDCFVLGKNISQKMWKYCSIYSAFKSSLSVQNNVETVLQQNRNYLSSGWLNVRTFWTPSHSKMSVFRSKTSPWLCSCRRTFLLRFECWLSWYCLILSHRWLWCPQLLHICRRKKTFMLLVLHYPTWEALQDPVLQKITSCECNSEKCHIVLFMLFVT